MILQKLRCLTILGLGLATMIASAQVAPGDRETVGKPWTGEKAVYETTAEIMARTPIPHESEEDEKFFGIDHEWVDRGHLLRNPKSPAVSQWPPNPLGQAIANGNGSRGFQAPSAPGYRGGPNSPQNPIFSFLGCQTSDSSGFPPDSQMAVGPTQILMFSNGRIRVFDKNGVMGALNTTPNTFFNSVRNGSGCSDPRARFDRLTNRWFLAIINVASSNNRVLFAVSDGPTITGATVWAFYFFQHNTVLPAGNTNQFFDYPTLGLDANALYLGANMFNGTFKCSAFVVRKSSITTGGPIVVTAFRDISVSGGAGPYTPQGVDNDDPAATEGYIIGVDNVSNGLLTMRRITDPGGTPTISGNLFITTPTTTNPANVNTSGATTPVDALDDRLMQAHVYYNRKTGTRTLWTSHQIRVDSTGVANSSGGRNGVRWYEIQNLSTTPVLRQAGTLYDPAVSAPLSYWMSDVTMSGQGHMALLASSASSTAFLKIVAAGRLNGDTLGTTQAPTLAQDSSTTYATGLQSGRYRWGDYSALQVDPTDDQTIWGVQEYCNATNSFGCRIVKLQAPAPAQPISLSPNSLAQGVSNVNLTLTGTSSLGSEFYDTQAGFNRIQAAFSGTGITVNSVAVIPEVPNTNPVTQLSINVSVSAGATVGARDITITNPDGQTSTGNSLLTITASGNPVPTLSTINPTAVTAGDPATVIALTGTGFEPTSVARWNGSDRTTTYNSATSLSVTLSASDIATAGNGTITVFNPAPAGGLSNGIGLTINPRVIAGTITLEGWGVSLSGITIQMDIRPVGGLPGSEVLSGPVVLNGVGNYTFSGSFPAGTYDVLAKGAIWLRNRVSSVNLTGPSTSGVNMTLLTGDIDNDNDVTNGDYAIWASNNGNNVAPGTGGDLDGDGDVTNADYALWAANNGTSGIP